MANCIQCGRKLPPLSFKKICQWCVQHEAAQRSDGDEDVKQRVMPTPWVRRQHSISLTQVIFGANVAVFLGMALATGSISDFAGPDLVRWGANYGPFTLSGQWWRLLTYMFLHGGLLHIFFNMWALWNLGGLCESLYGRWTYFAVYIVTGIAGGLASLAWNPAVLSVGASGALFGLIGALIASLSLGEFSLSGISIRGTLSSLIFWAGFSLFFGSVSPGIDNACHIGGLVSGMILGALIARLAPEDDQPLKRAAVFLFMILIVSGSALAIYRWRGYPLRFVRSMMMAEKNADRMIAALQNKIKQNPQDASAHYALAHAYFTKGQFPDGEEELKRVLELQPQNTRARIELGATYLSQEQPKEAQVAFTQLLGQDPNNAGAHVGLGMALADQQDHQGAIAEYKRALQLDPQASDVHYRMGVSYASLKQYDEAIAAFLAEKEIGDDYNLEIALADAYQAKGMTQQAQAARSKAEQLQNGR